MKRNNRASFASSDASGQVPSTTNNGLANVIVPSRVHVVPNVGSTLGARLEKRFVLITPRVGEKPSVPVRTPATRCRSPTPEPRRFSTDEIKFSMQEGQPRRVVVNGSAQTT